MRLALALVLALAAASPAFAEEKPAEPGAKAGDPGTNVEMPFLIAPLSKDGKLLGYAYISSKLVASSQRAATEIREKIAFVQDAFVRDVNAAAIATTADPTVADPKLLAVRLLADARKVMGAAKVVRIVFGDGTAADPGIVFSPLHQTKTPQKP